MVLGHTFSFYTQEEADRLVKFFRKEGISARVEPTSETSLTVLIKGKYDAIFSYLSDLKVELQTERISEEEESEELSEEDIQEDIDSIDEILTLIQKQREDAIRGLEGKNNGDVAFENNQAEDHDAEASIPPMFLFIFENKLLMDNEVIEFEDGKLIYKAIKPADELVYTFAVTDNLIPEEETLEKYDFTRVLRVHAEVEYKVRTGPELIARVQFDQLSEELEGYDVSEEFIAHAIHSILIKQELAEHIIKVIDITKVGTMEELFEALEMIPAEPEEGSRIYNSFDISPEYTNQAIEDLKKMELIRMKGNKIKLNR